jgi:hypothetical protein
VRESDVQRHGRGVVLRAGTRRTAERFAFLIGSDTREQGQC